MSTVLRRKCDRIPTLPIPSFIPDGAIARHYSVTIDRLDNSSSKIYGNYDSLAQDSELKAILNLADAVGWIS
jgi:hypothetical protein